MRPSPRLHRTRPTPESGRTPLSAPPPERRWLLLTHHVPPDPGYLRVKIRRRLEHIGAVPLKNSVYVLPPGEDTREDFEWVRREIEQKGGETTLSLASFLDETVDSRLVAAFRAARSADYARVARAAEDVLARATREPGSGKEPPASRTAVRQFERRLARVVAVDFFDAPGREHAERAVADLRAQAANQGAEDASQASPAPRRPEAATWVTRRGVKVDRTASAWLIRRFIDPAARFKFVAPRGYRPEPGEIRFDMFDGEYTHVEDRCTFETLLDRFGLVDRGLEAVGQIIHDIDCKDEKFARPEVSGIASVIDGITRASEDDHERVARAAAVFDSLYEHLRAASP